MSQVRDDDGGVRIVGWDELDGVLDRSRKASSASSDGGMG